MVERPLRMREVPGSIPGFSNGFFFCYTLTNCHCDDQTLLWNYQAEVFEGKNERKKLFFFLQCCLVVKRLVSVVSGFSGVVCGFLVLN